MSCWVALCFAFVFLFSVAASLTSSDGAFGADQTKDGKLLESLPRLLTFDSHPTSADFRGPFQFKGKKLTGSVEFLEKWAAQKDGSGTKSSRSAKNREEEDDVFDQTLKELGFKVRLFADGNELHTFDFPLKPLEIKTLKKGFILADERAGDLAVKIMVDEAEVKGKTIRGISFTVNLYSFGGDVDLSQNPSSKIPQEPATDPIQKPQPSAQPDGKTMELAKKLLQRADSIPEKNSAIKLMLYKQALAATPMPPTTAESKEFVAEIERKMNSLKEKPALPKAVLATEPSSVSRLQKHVPAAEAKKMFDEAVKLFGQHREPEGREQLRKALEKDPQYYEAWVFLGKNAYTNRKYNRACEALEKAISLKDDDIESAVLYFKSANYLGNAEGGIEKLSGMARRYPSSAKTRMAVAEAYYQAGNFTSCHAECLAILQSFPKNAEAQALLNRTQELMK